MAPSEKMLRAFLGLSCAGSLVTAASRPTGCGGDAACAARQEVDGLSALQTVGGRASLRSSESLGVGFRQVPPGLAKCFEPPQAPPSEEGDCAPDEPGAGAGAEHGYEKIGSGVFSSCHSVETFEHPPSGYKRDLTIWDQCSCGQGLVNITLWPDSRRDRSVTVIAGDELWIKWGRHVHKISWFCNGMSYARETSVDLKPYEVASVYLDAAPKEKCCSGSITGRVRLNTWERTKYTSSVPFVSGKDGFACFKIPSVMKTQKGTLIAFAEGRKESCSDFAATELVYRRSVDGGKTWGDLGVVVQVPDADRSSLGICGNPLVVGNIAPVQLSKDSKYPGRILAPYTRNNFKAWLTYSDDDGITWEGDRELPGMTVVEDGVDYVDAAPDCTRDMTYFGYDASLNYFDPANLGALLPWITNICVSSNGPYTRPDFLGKLTGAWQWVGTGPSKSLQLKSGAKAGRVIVPSYHSYIRGLPERGPGDLSISQLYNNFALGHVMISDDGGDTWTLSFDWEIGQGANENEMVELPDGSVLSNSRSLSIGSPQYRVQARSTDQGMSFKASEPTTIPQPFFGCQGSTVGCGETVYVSSPDPPADNSCLQEALRGLGCDVNLTGRRHVSVWKSIDAGNSYPEKVRLDNGPSGYSSLALADGKLYALYEQTDPAPMLSAQARFMQEAAGDILTVQVPDRFVFMEVQK